MHATVTVDPEGAASPQFDIDTSVKFYKRDNFQCDVVAETPDEIIDFDIGDNTVSRKSVEGEDRFVELFWKDGQLFVTDHGSTSKTFVKTYRNRVPLTAGENHEITATCVLDLGAHTDVEVGITGGGSQWPMVVQMHAENIEEKFQTGTVDDAEAACERFEAYFQNHVPSRSRDDQYDQCLSEIQSLLEGCGTFKKYNDTDVVLGKRELSTSLPEDAQKVAYLLKDFATSHS